VDKSRGSLIVPPRQAKEHDLACNALCNLATLASDNGTDFGSSKSAYAKALRERLLEEGLITSAERFLHHCNLALSQ
jgi:hypothetical protein